MRVSLFQKKIFVLFGMMSLSACYFSEDQGGKTIISFENQVAPLLMQSCASQGCHDSVSTFGALNLELNTMRSASDVYADLQSLSLLDLTSPEQSLLLTQASNSNTADPHGGGLIIDVGDSDYQLIVDWINAGVFNDDCSALVHGYANDVLPALSSCSGTGCHDVSAGLKLTGADAFSSMQAAINQSAPFYSDILQSGLGENSHPGGAVFGSNADPNFKTIYCWIKVDQAIQN